MKKSRKTICYIDGFNFYHSLIELGDKNLKWVNLWSLAASYLSPDDTLEAVHYFSAYATHKPEKCEHHKQYVTKLESVGVTSHIAHFKRKRRSCFTCKSMWWEHEEKETDVRMSLKLLEDAYEDNFDRAILITADTNLTPAVNSVKKLCPDKIVTISATKTRLENAYSLTNAADESKPIKPKRIAMNVFKDFNPKI